jgi:tetratricopeptide (TPR) repeat protein
MGTVEIVSFSSFEFVLLIPVLIAAGGVIILWRYLLPLSLRDLQVAFEVDEDLYEVHRLSRSSEQTRRLLDSRGVAMGVIAYLMAMGGVMLIIVELLIQPSTYFEPIVILTAVLVIVPILVSPIVTMYAQIRAMSKRQVTQRLTARMIGYIGTALAMGMFVSSILFYGYSAANAGPGPMDKTVMVRWIGYALLIFMSPTILAYGRIMGASWNTLMLSKWRTAKGWRTPIDPDKPRFLRRLISLLLVVFLGTMPITAINGIVTLIHVIINRPPDTDRLLDVGGILGESIYSMVEDSDLMQKIISLKTLEEVLASYLMLNVAIVGLAFIFELTRNLFLGGQTFGGVGGVILAQPRDIRTEREVQGRILFFGLAGFSGYIILLLVLQTYKEFSDLMPYGDGANEALLLEETWQFIAAGQAIFLLTWLLSISRFEHLRGLKFELSPDERREGAIMAGGGDWMRDHVETAARADDLAGLRMFQTEKIDGDKAVVRLEKGRARMIESAMRGLWPRAIEEAQKVLALQGGDDDEARMIKAAGHIACRRLDAAKEALRGMQLSEGYDEPELLALITEWLDPWGGHINPDDLYDWENISTIDHLRDMQKRFASWSPDSQIGDAHSDHLSLHAQLSNAAMLRAQRRSEEALDLCLDMVRLHPGSTLARIACALCLIDLGEWFDALNIFEEVNESSKADPRVQALSGILGFQCEADELETTLAIGTPEERAKWIDEAPANPYPALASKRGLDEALNANVMVIAHEALERGAPPTYTPPLAVILLNWLVLFPAWAVLGWLAWIQTGGNEIVGLGTTLSLFCLNICARRFKRQQRRVIRHRDQKAMIAYAKRMRTYKVNGDPTRVPVGNHLLLKGLLVTINGNVYDLGFPGWMVVRLPKERDRGFRNRLRSRMRELKSSRAARSQPLPERWWTKRPKPIDQDMRTLERLIGPAAYRGAHRRSLGIRRQELRAGVQSDRRPVMDTKPGQHGIPTHSNPMEQTGPKRPSSRPAAVDRVQGAGPARPGRRPKPSRAKDDGHE